MKLHPQRGIYLLITFLFTTIITTSSTAQRTGKIDWASDTISKADAQGANLTYLNKIKASGQPNATEKVSIPVDKLKEVIDACAKYGLSDVDFIFISIRQQDVAKFKKNNPNSSASDNEIKGSQLLVIKVPKVVFSGAAAAKINLTGNSILSASLLSTGFILHKEAYSDLPFATDSYYFSFGSICPPPASCDTFGDF